MLGVRRRAPQVLRRGVRRLSGQIWPSSIVTYLPCLPFLPVQQAWRFYPALRYGLIASWLFSFGLGGLVPRYPCSLIHSIIRFESLPILPLFFLLPLSSSFPSSLSRFPLLFFLLSSDQGYSSLDLSSTLSWTQTIVGFCPRPCYRKVVIAWRGSQYSSVDSSHLRTRKLVQPHELQGDTAFQPPPCAVSAYSI